MQISGLNLLKYKAGALGAPCYHRYLFGVTKLIHKYGGGILYYGTVRLCHPPAVTCIQVVASCE